MQEEFKKYLSLKINGKVYNGRESLLELAGNIYGSQDEESKYLSGFIKSWVDDSATIKIQTSGSTGTSKVIYIRKDAMVASAKRTIQFLNLKEGDSALLCLSTRFIAGKMMVVRSLVAGLDLIPTTVTSNPLTDLNCNVDFAAMVPLQVSEIIDQDSKLLNKVGKLIIGGGSVDSILASRIDNLNIDAWETYGMTETVSHIAMRKVSVQKRPFSLLQGFKILQDERQCLVLEPSDINDENLITNDVIEQVSADEFYLKGRYDNVINTGGIKVFPEQIEHKLEKVISDSFVILGIPDVKLGQRVVLVIEGKKRDKEIYSDLLQYLNNYERPKDILFMKVFPRTETGKINRYRILQQL